MVTLYTMTTADRASVLYDFKTIDTSKDIIVSFDYNSSGIIDNVGEGFSLFFTESINNFPKGGALGPGLGATSLVAISSFCYSIPIPPFNICVNIPVMYSGVREAALVVGFDITGKFGSNNSGLDGPSDPIPNSIAIRSGYNQNFNFIYRTPALTSNEIAEPFSLYSNDQTTYNTFRARLTNLGKNLILDHKIADGTFYNICNVQIPYDLPGYVYPCIGYSSGIRPFNLTVKNFYENGFFVTPTNTPTVTPTNTVTPTVTPSFTVTPSNTPTYSPTPSITPTNSMTPTITPTYTETPTETPTNTPTLTITPTNSMTPSITPTYTETPTVTPTNSMTPSITPTNTVTPSFTPTNTPTLTPTPTVTPTVTLPDYLPFPSQQNNIIINDNTIATPYPVTFSVAGITRTVYKVVVKLTNYTHSFVGDVGMLLVAPDGTSTIIAGRIGDDQQANNTTVVLDQRASKAWDGYTSGTFRPNSVADDFPFDAPAPTGPFSTTLDAFFYMPAVNANGTWKLYIQDFAADDAGTMQSAELRIYQYSPNASPTPTPTITPTFTPTPTVTPTIPITPTQTPTLTQTPTITPSITISPSNIDYTAFPSSTTNLIINDLTVATPYPLEIPVSGITNTTSRISISLSGYDHSYPEDVVMLLVSPVNTACIISGRIGLQAANNINVILDQSASLYWDGYSPGMFKPNTSANNFDMSLTNGCPTGPYNTSMAVFNNLPYPDVNGTWKLYIQDFAAQDTGTLYRAILRLHHY